MADIAESSPNTNGTYPSSHENVSPSTMKIPISPQRASDLVSNLSTVLARISTASSAHSTHPPRLVAVSKLKPASDILALHSPPSDTSASLPTNYKPQLHFGENYVQELTEKSRLLPRSIRWHMIGGLQSNKCRDLARDVPNLWAVESVDSQKKAGLLEKGRAEMLKKWEEEEKKDTQSGDDGQVVEASIAQEKLRVFVQVNTSGEESKSGVEPKGKELLDLCKYILMQCPHLHLQGLMTIGAIARSQASTPETVNEDFVCLKEARDEIAAELDFDGGQLELSMGMSEDFEAAIAQGSSEVRVGSTIFGERPPKKEARVLEDPEKAK